MSEYLKVAQVAALWGVSGQRVRDLILAQRLAAVKRGRDWWIPRAAVLEFRRLPRGRPRSHPPP